MADSKFYVVDASLLPEVMVKVAEVKERLGKNKKNDLPSLLKEYGISKSTWYKYKDGITTFNDIGAMEIVNLSFLLNNKQGTLSEVLIKIAEAGGNVMTIHQSLPSHGSATVTLSVDNAHAVVPLGELVSTLSNLDGVINVRVEGIEKEKKE